MEEISGRFLFDEKQHFPKWLTVFMISPVMITVGVTLALGLGGESDLGELFLVLGIIIPLQAVMYYLFRVSRLEKVVTSNGLYFRWPPLQRKYRLLEAGEIDSIEIKKAPTLQYGAKRVPGYGKAHSVSDGRGTQVYLHNGKKIFFGTAKPEEFFDAIQKMKTAAKPETYGWIKR